MKIFKIAQSSNKEKDLLKFNNLINKLQEMPKKMESPTNTFYEILGENDELPFMTRLVRNEITNYIDDYPEWVSLIPENLRSLFNNFTFSRAWK